ncbi:MAG: DUF4168 domain-containing protein [Hyphomonadaceae bacterium]|nr:DUF4168 domain-containing protein [Hyphomonadaceae bacterium]
MRTWRTFAAAGVSVAALSIAACAGTTSTASNTTASTSTASATQTQPTDPASMTDEQLRSYVVAREAITPLQESFATQTPEQRTQTTAQITQILQSHGLTPQQYNAISSHAAQDTTFGARLAALTPDTFADANLRAFAQASVEIDPITRDLGTATPEQQAQATTQIREILERNNLDSTTYNAIAARAQAEPAFAQRIQTIYREAQAQDDSNGSGE